MKRLLVLMMVLGLIFGSITVADAKKKKKKAPPVPVQADIKYFLRSDNECDGPRYLTTVDGVDQECVFFDSGLLYDSITEAGLLAVEDLAHEWIASDGAPFTLDATKPITGEISTSSVACAAEGACSPVGLGVGNAKLIVIMLAEIGGSEVEIGRHEESFTVLPGDVHNSKVSVQPDPALDKSQVTGFRILTWLHGQAAGHGQIEMDDPSSFLSVPSWR